MDTSTASASPSALTLLSSGYRPRRGGGRQSSRDEEEDDTEGDTSDQQRQPRSSSVIMTMESIRDVRIEYGLHGQEAAVRAAFNELDSTLKGYLTSDDLFDFFALAAESINVKVEDQVIQAAVQALMDDVGATPLVSAKEEGIEQVYDGDGAGGTTPDADNADVATTKEAVVTFEQFASIFQRHPDLCRVFDDSSVRQSLRQTVLSLTSSLAELEEEAKENRQVYQPYRPKWTNQTVEYMWIAIYVALNVIVFTNKAINYSLNPEALAVFGQCILAARGAAACLNLNCMLILVPICRHFLTHLQSTRLRYIIPFDVYLECHFLIGMVILLFVIVHVSAHICDFYRFAYADEADIYALIGNKLGPIPESPSARWKLVLSSIPGVTGLIMVFFILVAYPLILVRRKRFNVFWTSHHLLIGMLIALAVHGTANLLEPYQSLYWIIGPLSIYTLGKLLRETPLTKCQVLDVQLKTGNVVHVQVSKPPRWHHRLQAGMYGFLNIPHLSWWEWHPFTFSSCPDDPYVEFHFQTVGDWTTNAYKFLEQQQEVSQSDDDKNDATIAKKDADDEEDIVVPTKQSSHNSSLAKALYFRVDGPMGASSQGFADHPVVVLVGAGIGITPMISVLKHLLHHPGKMKQTYFYWTVRDHNAFQWFSDLLDDIYDHDLTHCLQLRHFVTSIKFDDRDIGAVLLAYAAKAAHQKTNIDLLLGRRTRHQIDSGRPNWSDEFCNIKNDTKDLGFDDCGIFLCGPIAMAKEIAKESVALSDANFHFHFTKETF